MWTDRYRQELRLESRGEQLGPYPIQTTIQTLAVRRQGEFIFYFGLFIHSLAATDD